MIRISNRDMQHFIFFKIVTHHVRGPASHGPHISGTPAQVASQGDHVTSKGSATCRLGALISI